MNLDVMRRKYIEESEKSAVNRSQSQDTSGSVCAVRTPLGVDRTQRIVRVGGRLAVVAQWQSAGGSSLGSTFSDLYQYSFVLW